MELPFSLGLSLMLLMILLPQLAELSGSINIIYYKSLRPFSYISDTNSFLWLHTAN